MNEENCAGRGSPIWNALVVTETPSRPTFHEPVITIVSPVIVQITSVSIKVPIIEIRPCCAGASATAAAAAIGALPRPASLEKIPLATPICIAIIIEPIAPPPTARRPNALCTIVARALGIFLKLYTRIASVTTKYVTAIKGTITCATDEILLRPPMSTRAVNIVRSMPDIITDHEYSRPNSVTAHWLLASKKLFTALVIPLICVNVPIPRRPTPTPKNANNLASHFHFFPFHVQYSRKVLREYVRPSG